MEVDPDDGDRRSGSRTDVDPDSTCSTVDPSGDPGQLKSRRFFFYKNLFMCNTAFFCLFSSFVGLAIIQSSVYGQIGVIGLCIIFFTTVVACIVLAPVGVSLLGCKATMVASFLGFMAWELSNFYPHWATTIPAAVLCGMANGAIWAAQATYFTKRSIEFAQLTKDGADMIIARSFGTFFCFLLLGTSVGCLVTSAILSADLDPDSSDLTPTEVPGGPMMHCGAGFCHGHDSTAQDDYLWFHAAMVEVTARASSNEYQRAGEPNQPAPEQVYLMVGVHTATTCIGLILLMVFLDPLPNEKSEETLGKRALQSILGTLNQLRRRRQLLLTPLNVYVGISKSFMLADITQAYIGCALGVDMIGYASVTYGITAFAASLTCGHLIRKTGRIPIFSFAYISALSMSLFLLLWLPDSTQEAMFYLIPALWAIPDAIFISQMNAIYGYMFADNAQGAFATFRFWEGIGLVLGYIFSITICVSDKLYIMLALGAVGILCYFCVEYVQRRYEREHSQGIHNISLESRRSRSHSTEHGSPPPGSSPGGVSVSHADTRLGMFYIAVPRKQTQRSTSMNNSNTQDIVDDAGAVDYFTTSIFETSI